MPELNFCVVNESNQNSQDSIREHFGTETAPPVAMSEGQVRNEESSEFGQSLEGELIELMKDYRCVWDTCLVGPSKRTRKNSRLGRRLP